jgi:predicted ester cyclase
MSAENTAIIRRYVEEGINQKNLAVLTELAPDERLRRPIDVIRSAFPDVYLTIEDLVAEGDKVTARLTIRGTHNGSFLGVLSTGKPICVPGIAIYQLTGGKIVERWLQLDQLGILRQLGVLPTAGR